ncbi:double-strand break repair helicase AddA [Phyllobacterium leguminum]|uniref:DNA 3'-5' helicase n=1 Tax=Phyllobacterium leguminum TaxID=314237 RepID=A0A318T4T6_9HYPH|nr:double-strand break repair helicase AddA [Phyllobacterium leguminum]PYE89098.1 DNA helicase/exodeoxyribonuclease V subunit A [Phyllobacterium leguminum]
MKKRLVIPPETLAAQARAANPRDSVWVSANAGSGKTHVLTERVIRLLLEGTDPSRILCLTYTKAAAAVMQNRVFARLSEWATLSDEALAEKLEQLEGKRPGAARLKIARRLFARALETPGGLKIQTIHAFCEAILHQFPLEANIAGHFELMDDLMQVALVGDARRQLLENARTEANPELAKAFADVLSAAGEMGLQTLLDEAVSRRHALQHFIREVGGNETRQPLFYAAFGFSGGEREEDILGQVWPMPAFSDVVLDRILTIAKGATRAQDFALQLREMKKASTQMDREEILRLAFLKSTGEPKAGSYVASKPVTAMLPDFEENFDQAAARVYAALDRLKQLRLIRLNLSAFVLIDDLLSRYQAMKRSRGLLDFDDLINRTVSLLAREGAGHWVQYKLDRGIDHILVDEAQDTSPEQWQVIHMLSAEFFTGSGQRDIRRTLFAVGDEKQSIYSFQGAVPEDFAASGKAVRQKAESAELTFGDVRLNFSFRSTPDVLSAVDLVFERPEAYRGLGLEPGPTQHDAIRRDAPGEVEIWDLLAPQAVEEPEDWRVPVDHLAAPAVRLAEQIAATIRHWLDNGETIPGQQRKLEARDIMVLVRKRDQFMPALSRALKNLGVPVAGADRLKLTGHIAIKDLMALGRFVLQPADDLSLAALLKSPLFGWDDDRLFALAHPREASQTLFERMGQEAEVDPALAATHETLQGWRAAADTVPVFEFYARILGAWGARRKLLARLGPEAGDVIDEFQNYALAAEKTGLPGLQAFLETLDAATPEIKRELDQNRDEVRIMTVHAAKGLEAAVVFLIDPGSAAWTANRAPKLIPFDMKEPEQAQEKCEAVFPEKARAFPSGLRENKDFGWEGRGFIWQPNGGYETAFTAARIEELKRRAEEEYRRLLYVGMTRAEDRLIICGYRGARDGGETWHQLVSGALAERCEPINHPVEGVVARRYRKTVPGEVVIAAKDEAAAMRPDPLPENYRRAMKREPGLPRPLSPSGASVLIEANDETVDMPGSPVLAPDEQAPGFAIRRGTVIHALLQRLPDVAEEERRMVAERYLDHAAGDWPDAERQKALESVFAVLNDQRFAPVFGKGSRAEVEIMGTLKLRGKEHAVSGKIDRLAVEKTRVTIIDYKTNRPAPRDFAQVPEAYIAQLALYRALLRPLYPDLAVEAALLFTEGPHLITIPAQAMDEAVAALETIAQS